MCYISPIVQLLTLTCDRRLARSARLIAPSTVTSLDGMESYGRSDGIRSWRNFMQKLFVFLIGAAALSQNAPDHPSVTVQGQSFTPRSILARNMGTPDDQTTAFPPHKIVGNVYYVGTRTLSSFLVVTPAGNILIDSTYERNVRTIEKSIQQLGFKFSDVKILLGNHAHGDHQ